MLILNDTVKTVKQKWNHICLAVSILWMGGRRSVSYDLWLFIHEDQLARDTGIYTILRLLHKSMQQSQTSIHKHTSLHTAAGQAAVENIWKGQTPTCLSPFMLCLHFSRDPTLVGRCIHSLVLQMQSTEPTKTHIWPRFLSVLARSSSVAALSPLWMSLAGRILCPGSTPGENTGSPYWAVLSEPTLEPMTY